VLAREPDAATALGRLVQGKRDVLLRRVGLLAATWPARAAGEIAMLAGGRARLGDAPERARSWLASIV
jgi:hypothetical protein